MSKIKIGIIFGGRSGEHEVSLVSASNVIKALNPDKYEPYLIGITKEGKWVFGEESLEALKKGTVKGLHTATIHTDPLTKSLITLGSTEFDLTKLDVVFPVLHGPYGEDGTIQGLLEVAGIPYVGCGVLASSVAMDKLLTKAVWRDAGLPQVPYVGFLRKEWETDRGVIIKEILGKLKFPLFVKPVNMGSSVGISKVKSDIELTNATDLAAKFDRKIVVEQGLPVREIEVAVLGNDEPSAAEIGEVLVAGEFYDFNDKYVDGKSQTQVPADISEKKREEAKNLALRAFKAIDGAGMARVDLFLHKETSDFYLNEINTIPGFTAISMYPKMWETAGLPYPALIDRLIELAFERHKDKERNVADFRSGSNWYKG